MVHIKQEQTLQLLSDRDVHDKHSPKQPRENSYSNWDISCFDFPTCTRLMMALSYFKTDIIEWLAPEISY